MHFANFVSLAAVLFASLTENLRLALRLTENLRLGLFLNFEQK